MPIPDKLAEAIQNERFTRIGEDNNLDVIELDLFINEGDEENDDQSEFKDAMFK